MPLDGSGDEKGSFACGRNDISFEAKEVRLPQDANCDNCILQLEWKTERGKINTCADISVSGAEVSECFGKCMNGGICSNGACLCSEEFEGSNCQYAKEADDGGVSSGLFSNLMVLLVYAILISIIVGLFALAYYFLQEAKKKVEANKLEEKVDDLVTKKKNQPKASNYDKGDDY